MISILCVKTNFRIITKNHAAATKIRFVTKSISKPYGRATAMPTAWELKSAKKIILIGLTYWC